MLAIRPDLVQRNEIRKKTRAGLPRFALHEEFETGFNWFASNPDHYQGGGHLGTPHKGEILLEAAARALAKAFKAVKQDTSAKRIADEFFALDPGRRVPRSRPRIRGSRRR